MPDGIKRIVQRFGRGPEESLITSAYHYLEESERNSGMAQGEFSPKEAETKALIRFCTEKNLWFEKLEFSKFIDEGAEQKVFFDVENLRVVKLNDGIFYVNWRQYLESLIIHNLLFSNTKYELLGFLKINEILYSVVNQIYIEPDRPTSIQDIQKLMNENGFDVKKNNDYIHYNLGLIIEDLHEENVLTRENTLFFIDTVIYLKD